MLEQNRDALHVAFTIIANAANCLESGDPVLAKQWHEAAQKFIQDYNDNLDIYTGYMVRSGLGRSAKTVVSEVSRGDKKLKIIVCSACSSVIEVKETEND